MYTGPIIRYNFNMLRASVGKASSVTTTLHVFGLPQLAICSSTPSGGWSLAGQLT